MDLQQQMHQYMQDTMYMVNPPSFDTWLKQQQNPTYQAEALKAAAASASEILRNLRIE